MELKQVIVVRTDLKMGRGKTAAQSAHASLAALEKTLQQHAEWAEEWKTHGQAKVVLKIGSEKELLELFEKTKKKLPCALIVDAGRTQVESGSKTCVGIGPAPSEKIDEFTKQLKLL
jgi:PTH2 family peptidyl-tRNA hydrolase